MKNVALYFRVYIQVFIFVCAEISSSVYSVHLNLASVMISNRTPLICCAQKIHRTTEAYCTPVRESMNPDGGSSQWFTSTPYTTSPSTRTVQFTLPLSLNTISE
jgi:hypothetical protein